MKKVKLIVAFAVHLLLTASLHAAQVTVFAAASLTDSLKQIAADYEKDSGDKIVFNFAASGVLARQIEAGAPADVFFSADETQMDRVSAKGLIVSDSRRDLVGNTLVIVTTPDSSNVHSAADLTNAAVHRVALGDPQTVPAGNYGRSYLEKIGCWAAIQPKVVPCENVRSVLAVVESGNADAGIVYRSDAMTSKKVKVACEISASEGPKITYPVASVKGAAQADAAGKFISYLAGEQSARTFRDHGFLILPRR